MERSKGTWALYALFLILGGIAFLGLRGMYAWESIMLGAVASSMAYFVWFAELWNLRMDGHYMGRTRWVILLLSFLFYVGTMCYFAYIEMNIFAKIMYTISYIVTAMAWLLVRAGLEPDNEQTL